MVLRAADLELVGQPVFREPKSRSEQVNTTRKDFLGPLFPSPSVWSDDCKGQEAGMGMDRGRERPLHMPVGEGCVGRRGQGSDSGKWNGGPI